MRAGTYGGSAHAKVNLGLAVLARRGDGYHEIETLMALIDLADELEIEVLGGGTTTAAEPGIEIEVEPGDGAGELVRAPLGGENLVVLAARAYLRAYQEARSAATAAPRGALPVAVNGADATVAAGGTLRVRLTKRVPVAAGLGGGSADAAAALRLLARADAASQGSGRPLVEPAALLRLATELGSDVPFFLSGHRAALARGRGERLAAVEPVPLNLVLVNPGTPVSAAHAYSDLVGFTPRLKWERARDRLSAGLEPAWPNGLQPGVLRRHPEVREALTALRSEGLRGVLMSGSGATCFGIAGSSGEAAAVKAKLEALRPAWWVRTARTLT